jgi:hypothetical protein
LDLDDVGEKLEKARFEYQRRLKEVRHIILVVMKVYSLMLPRRSALYS